MTIVQRRGVDRSPRSQHRVPAGRSRRLAVMIAAVLVALPAIAALSAILVPRETAAQVENLLDRISNERMVAFEQRVEDEIDAALHRYLSAKQYVLSVRVIWDRSIIPAITAPGLQPSKQKLPGFPIFVRSPSSPVDDGAPSFTRLVVKILLDETLPEYYERFLRKIVPIVARFTASRGDQLIVLKETFPELSPDELPPTIPEKELMEQIGQPLAPPAEAPGAAPVPDAVEEARIAYQEDRYMDSLRIVQAAFQRATSNPERATYLSMEGSIFYSLDNLGAARASWQRALIYDPGNMEVHRVMNYLDKVQSQPRVETR